MLSIEQITEIKRLQDTGYNAGQISRELQISRSTVKQYLLPTESPENIELPQRIKKGHARPQVPDPTLQLKTKREEAETADLEVSIQRKVKELEKIKGSNDDSVKKKEEEVRLVELSAKEIRVKNEIRKLESSDREERERERRGELLEEIKLFAIPPTIKKYLSPSLLIITLSGITEGLLLLIDGNKMSEEELKIAACVIRNKIWMDPQYSEMVRSILKGAILNILDECLRECNELLKEEEASLDGKTYLPVQFQVMGEI